MKVKRICQYCGKEFERYLRPSEIKKGRGKYCNRKCLNSDKIKDLTGKKFGRLTVIKKVKRLSHLKVKGLFWLCKCKCGNYTSVRSNSLLRGNTRSCGCMRNEIASKICQQWQKEKNPNWKGGYKARIEREKIKQKNGQNLLKGNYGDFYLKKLLHNQLEISSSEISPELIEMQRAKIQYKRLRREITNQFNLKEIKL